MKTENKLTKITGIRITESLDKQIEKYCKKNNMSKPDLLREIITEYFSPKKIKSLKELNRQVENFLPDFKKMQKEYREMQSKMTEYISESMEVHSYIAEMKSAESYYFRELKQMFESNQKLTISLIEKLSGETLAEPQEISPEMDSETNDNQESTRPAQEVLEDNDKEVVPVPSYSDELRVSSIDQPEESTVLSTEDEEHEKVKQMLGL